MRDTTMINETLASAHRLHLGVTAASAGLLAIAVSGHRSHRYETALDEIAIIQNIPFDSMARQIAASNNFERVYNRENLSRSRSWPTPTLPEEPKRDVDLTVTLLRLLNPPSIRIVARDSVERSHSWGRPTVYMVPEIHPQSTISEIAAVVEGDSAILAATPGNVLLDSAHIKLLDLCRRNPGRGRFEESIWISDQIYITYCSSTSWSGRMMGWRGSLRFVLYSDPSTTFREVEGPHGTYSIAGNFKPDSFVILPQITYLPRTRPFVIQWLISRGTDRSIFEEHDGGAFAFPRLRAVWSEVKDLSLSEAATHLRDRVSETQQQASLFGLSVDEGFVSIAGPVLLIAMMIYLQMYISHVIALLSGLEEDKRVSDYPWPILFSGRLPEIVRFVTVILLPVTASVMITLRSIQSRPEIITSLSIGLVLCLMVTTYIANRTCAILSRTINVRMQIVVTH